LPLMVTGVHTIKPSDEEPAAAGYYDPDASSEKQQQIVKN